MANKKILLVAVVATIMIIGVTIWIGNQSLNWSDSAAGEDNSSRYSKDIVFDGDHYKLQYDVFTGNGHLYISLVDLREILDLEVEQAEEKVSITYQDNQLIYDRNIVQNSQAKENEIREYLVDNDVVYLPDLHLKKYLGIQVDYYLDQKTNTIQLSSPEEQQKEAYDKGLGTTIFLHKDDVPLAKYEPQDGIYLGGYVIQDEFIDTSMNKFNEVSGKNHASYFRYVGYGQPFPTEWVHQVKSVGGFPQIAWEPNNGLEEVKDDEYLREFAKKAREVNVPILLRYASEMNGNWTAYSGNADLYIKKWKLVHDVMEEEAPNVMMLWNVFTMPEHTISKFYPGDEYVDYVGVNIYNVVYHNDRLEDKSDFEDPLRLLDYVYNRYSDTKPIVIGEFGATNYTVTDGLYHVDFAEEKISRMYKYLPKLYPRVKAIYYFDVNNLVNAPEGRKINNYAITENSRITEAYSSQVEHQNYLSGIVDKAERNSKETFSYRDFLFYYQNELFVNVQFVEEYLQMNVAENDTEFSVAFNDETVTIQKEMHTIDKAAFFEKREIKGISLDELLDAFDMEHEYDGDGNLHIYLSYVEGALAVLFDGGRFFSEGNYHFLLI